MSRPAVSKMECLLANPLQLHHSSMLTTLQTNLQGTGFAVHVGLVAGCGKLGSSRVLVPRGEKKLCPTTLLSQRSCTSKTEWDTRNMHKLVPLKPLLKAKEREKKAKDTKYPSAYWK